MGDYQKNEGSLLIADLTNYNASSSSQTTSTQFFDLAEIAARNTNLSAELIDLTDDNNTEFSSNIPVIDLSSDDEQFDNYRTTVTKLKNYDVQDVIRQTQCIDMKNDASSNNPTTELIDLTVDKGQDFNCNTPLINFTCGNDQFVNYRIPSVDTINDDAHHISHQLQCTDLTDDKQQQINDFNPSIDFTHDNDQSIDKIVQTVDRIRHKHCDNDRRPYIDLASHKGLDICRRSMFNMACDNAEDIGHNVEVLDLIDGSISSNAAIPNYDYLNSNIVDDDEDSICSNLPSSSKNDKETLLGIPAVTLFNDATEIKVLKYDKTSNMNLMHVGISSSMQQCHLRKERTLVNYSQNIKYGEKNLHPGEKSGKLPQNNISAFLKPAHRPIPLRHSLRRSTPNTSKNILIEYTENSEGEARTSTVSSIFRRKQLKLSNDISEQSLPMSLETRSSRSNIFSLDAFKEFFLKFWILVFYWILNRIRRILYT